MKKNKKTKSLHSSRVDVKIILYWLGQECKRISMRDTNNCVLSVIGSKCIEHLSSYSIALCVGHRWFIFCDYRSMLTLNLNCVCSL